MPRKTLKERNTEANRIKQITAKLKGTENPEDIMLELLEVLTETVKIPSPGKYYTFVYKPKTAGIQYDEHPLVGVSQVYTWGFRGVNVHWGDIRQYSWEEVIGDLHLIYDIEVKDVKSLPFRKIKTNK